MAFNFEKFVDVGSSFVPKISIRKNGVLGFSQGALRRFDLAEGNWHLILHYDKKARVIGIQKADDQQEGAIKLIKRTHTAKDGKTNIISHLAAKSFLEKYNIDYEVSTQSFKSEWDEEHQMIIIDLNKPLNTKREKKLEKRESTDPF